MANITVQEASEVLHTMLGVERIDRKTLNGDNQASDHAETDDDITDIDITADDDPISLRNEVYDTESYYSEVEQNSTTKTKKTSEKSEPTKLEDSPKQVSARLVQGCECKEGCFKGLSAENVYKHRLNIADLTKEEHDMYLMGLVMACLGNREKTCNRKQRIRQRASYIYQGKKVCFDAFLYLENVTHYHLKRIRNHVMKNGVTPRVHGNMGKKPHNTFSLDLYKKVEEFLKSYLKHFTNDLTRHIVIYGETRPNVYNKYKTEITKKNTNEKIMGYSSFRHFMQKQFPNVRFSPRTDNCPKPNLTLTSCSAILSHKQKDGAGREVAVKKKSDSNVIPVPSSTQIN